MMVIRYTHIYIETELWKTLRKRAIDLDISASKLVVDLIKKEFNWRENEKM